jgi:alpha-D-ribose 1-methylphosphonate 5-triphosphate synthase subunit PhnG
MSETQIKAERQRAWSVLAESPLEELEQRLAGVGPIALRLLRQPEIGLVMVRGRMGGVGRRFNLGEMTVTRCAVTDGTVIGHGYVRGRDRRKAELIARCDALLQMADRRELVREQVVEPLARARAEMLARDDRRAAATRVEFFTLVRGED